MPRLLRSAVLVLALALAACAMPVTTPLLGALPPPPPGTARIVFYRPLAFYEPSDVLTIYLNGAETATDAVGAVVYRDVAPGTYTITFRPTRNYPDQFKTVTAAPGTVFYVRFDALADDPCGSPYGGSCRNAGYTSLVVDPALAAREIYGLDLSPG